MLIPTNELLFNTGILSDWLEIKLTEAKLKSSKTDASEFTGGEDEAIVAALVDQFAVSPIEWVKPEADVSQTERSIDVSGDPRRVRFGSGPVMIPGTVFTYTYQFTGTAQLFSLRPSHYTMNPPRGAVTGQNLEIGVLVPNDAIDVNAIEEHMRVQFNSINSYLASSAKQVEEYRNKLPEKVGSAVNARRVTLSAASSALEELRKRQGN